MHNLLCCQGNFASSPSVAVVRCLLVSTAR